MLVAGMGAVLHTLNIRLGEKDLEYIINHAEDQVIIADADIQVGDREWVRLCGMAFYRC